MEIPKTNRSALGVNPNVQIIYSLPKAGKTSICSKLPNHLIVELEPGGADYVDGRIVDISKPSEFNDLIKTIKIAPEPTCDFLIIDTVTKLDEWSEIVGTYEFMNKPQGKSFNRIMDPAAPIKLKHTDKEFETVHELPNGFGYQYSRNVMSNWYDDLLELIALKKVKYVILLAHVKDKFLDNKIGDLVQSMELSLTGKVKNMYTSRVDAIGYLIRRGKQAFISYNNNEKTIAGGRCSHLQNEILVSEFDNNEVKTFWKSIYIEKEK